MVSAVGGAWDLFRRLTDGSRRQLQHLASPLAHTLGCMRWLLPRVAVWYRSVFCC
jgi:hypothetical protein